MPSFNPQINPIQNQNPSLPTINIPNPLKGIGVGSFINPYWNKPKIGQQEDKTKGLKSYSVSDNKEINADPVIWNFINNTEEPINDSLNDNNWNNPSPIFRGGFSSAYSAGKFNNISPVTLCNRIIQNDDSTGYLDTPIGLPNVLLDKTIVTVKETKNIVTTKVLGKNGTVKEYIGLDDFEITIEGTLFGTNGIYPYDKVKNLIWYCKSASPIRIECEYLQTVWGVSFVVIKDFDISMEQSGVSQQNFTLTCISDTFWDPAFPQSNPYIAG